jgi:putative NADPH-quinone reductase
MKGINEMNILIINGSPKGKTSITLQTLNYLSILHPEHNFEVLCVGQLIKSYEKDMTPAIDAIKKAELLIFSYPVYTFIAPSQLHRFIELMKASGADF